MGEALALVSLTVLSASGLILIYVGSINIGDWGCKYQHFTALVLFVFLLLFTFAYYVIVLCYYKDSIMVFCMPLSHTFIT